MSANKCRFNHCRVNAGNFKQTVVKLMFNGGRIALEALSRNDLVRFLQCLCLFCICPGTSSEVKSLAVAIRFM